MTTDNNMGRFFDWLVKPMSQDDITSWYLANNITPELTELFRDFCVSLMDLLKDTYLGDDGDDDVRDTKVGMTDPQKKDHFKWCWNTTVTNFKKENIDFNFNKGDSEFIEAFFFDIFYNQTDIKLKENIDEFFKQIFNYKEKKTKSDIEIFTDIYKVLERSLKND
jgi:hypothetical protein